MANGQRIIDGMADVLAYYRGEPNGVTIRTVNVPKSVDVRKVRTRLKMSQGEFAMRFGFTIGTVRNWEQGRRHPAGSDRVLLTLIERNPKMVQETLAAA
jgi:putative transcriptional regulator